MLSKEQKQIDDVGTQTYIYAMTLALREELGTVYQSVKKFQDASGFRFIEEEKTKDLIVEMEKEEERAPIEATITDLMKKENIAYRQMISDLYHLQTLTQNILSISKRTLIVHCDLFARRFIEEAKAGVRSKISNTEKTEQTNKEGDQDEPKTN